MEPTNSQELDPKGFQNDPQIAPKPFLLQFQKHSNFASKANKIYVNRDINECKRAKYQFGKRKNYYCNDAVKFIYILNKQKINLQNNIFYKRKNNKNLLKKSNTPVKSLSDIFKAINKINSTKKIR